MGLALLSNYRWLMREINLHAINLSLMLSVIEFLNDGKYSHKKEVHSD